MNISTGESKSPTGVLVGFNIPEFDVSSKIVVRMSWASGDVEDVELNVVQFGRELYGSFSDPRGGENKLEWAISSLDGSEFQFQTQKAVQEDVSLETLSIDIAGSQIYP